MSSQQNLAYVRDSQIDELENNQAPIAIEPNTQRNENIFLYNIQN